MSVFKKLKGSIQKSQQDFVNGLKTLTTFEGHLRHEQLQHIRSKDINLNVGADLLNSYQEAWAVIQNQTKECSAKAETVAVTLDPMIATWDNKLKVITQLEEEVKIIPHTVSSLKEMQTLIGTLRQDFAVVEKSLDMLENLCEEVEFKRATVEEQKKLAHYTAMKMAQAEKVKVDLATSHARHMSQLETVKRNSLQERAEAFTSAFQEDLEFYKTHGHPDIHVMPTEFPKVTSLSDIQIEQDQKALDFFLGPSQQEVPAEEETDEPYFEDDYISDYSVKQDAEFIEESELDTLLYPDGPHGSDDTGVDKHSPDLEDFHEESGEKHMNQTSSLTQRVPALSNVNAEADSENSRPMKTSTQSDLPDSPSEQYVDDSNNESKLHNDAVSQSSEPS